jgi:hypothetical protein
MNLPFLEFSGDNFTRSQFNTIPIEGYVIPKNEFTGKELPYCCAQHEKFYLDLKNLFSKFPDCCDIHREVAKNPLFEKEKYLAVPEKIINQVCYTQHHISALIDSEDWLNEITDYIDYNNFSFGHPSIGLEHYQGYLLKTLNDNVWLKDKNVPASKAVKIVEYLKECRNPTPPKERETDLNILYTIYQNWLKIFPFELSFFKELKPDFEKQFPLIKEHLRFNKYLNSEKFKIHTKSSLIEFLLDTTNAILTTVNSLELHKEWSHSDADKIKLEIIVEQRKMKINKGIKINPQTRRPDTEKF